MVTKGIIKSIDLLGNTCTVHIPFFETAGNDPIIETATVSNTPGSYNGYKVGDVVYVAFEDGSMSTPVIIGKLYLGTEKEKADPRGVSNVEESTAAKKATLPADSKLTAEIDSNVPNTTVPYSSLSSIANGLNTLNTNVGQMDRDYGNRLKQVISDTSGLASTIEQTASKIRQEVADETSNIRSELEQTATNMVAKVSGYEIDEDGNQIPTEFGWNLETDSWSLFNEDKTILIADENGLHISGRVDAESGHIGNFMIGNIGISSSTNEGNSETAWIPNYATTPTTDTGVYVGTDGIRLGQKFSVDNQGNVSAASLIIGQDQVSGLSDSLQGATDSAVTQAAENVTKGLGLTEGSSSGKIKANYLELDAGNISGKLTANQIDVTGLKADGIKVVKKDENGNAIATADGEEVIIFNADAEKGTVEMSGFTVSDRTLYAGELDEQQTQYTTYVNIGPGKTKPDYITFTGEQILQFQQNTGLTISYNSDIIEITAQLTNSTNPQVIFGYCDSKAKVYAALCAFPGLSEICWCYTAKDGSPVTKSTKVSRADTQIHTYKITPQRVNNEIQQALFVDGKNMGTFSMAESVMGYPFYIGGCYSNNTYTNYLHGNIYKIKLIRNSTTTYSWLPDIKNTKDGSVYGFRLLNRSPDAAYAFETPINNSKLSGEHVISEAIYLGDPDSKLAPFSVTSKGELKAAKGTIGGLDIATDGLSFSTGSNKSAFGLNTFSNTYQRYRTILSGEQKPYIAISKITFTRDVPVFRCFMANAVDSDAHTSSVSITSRVKPQQIPIATTSPYVYQKTSISINDSDSEREDQDLGNYYEILYYGLKKDDTIYFIHEAPESSYSSGYLAVPADGLSQGAFTWQGLAQNDLTIPTDPSVTSDWGEWELINDAAVPYSAVKLTVGDNFSVTGRGILNARAGDIGPFNITDQMLWYNFNGYKRDNTGKLLSSYDQNNKAYWQGDTFTFEGVKELRKNESGQIVDDADNVLSNVVIEGEYRNTGKIHTYTSIDAAEGIKTTNIKKLIYNKGNWIESTAVSCLTVKETTSTNNDARTAPAITGILSIPITAKASTTSSGMSDWQTLDESVLSNLIPFGGLIFYTQKGASSANGTEYFNVIQGTSTDVAIRWYSNNLINVKRFNRVHFKCGNGYNAETFNKNFIATLVLFGTIVSTT